MRGLFLSSPLVGEGSKTGGPDVAEEQGAAERRVSVVINTYNRGPSLRQTLRALRYQTHGAFEVVVVNGPSTDSTAEVLAEFEDARVVRCPEVHLSKSRNVGIDEAAGEIVAFIDDDALPEPTWLAELVAAYDTARVGGAGGVTYDHTGFSYQYRYSVCDRLGNTRFDVEPPFDAFTAPGANPFVYLQGTNCSFLRRCLVAIGGFDEEIEYYMDEVDVCRRVIDLGYVLRPLAGAAVHHKYLASHLRNSKKVVFDPFPNVKNHCYLAILNNRDRLPLEELGRILRVFADGVKAVARSHFAEGKFTAEQRDHFERRVEQGYETGIARGIAGKRLHREFAPPDPERFRPYHTLRPEGGQLKVCFVSQEYPPGDFGGIGRFTCDLAEGFAALGHEVHVVTRSPDVNRVDFEEGVWLHRLAAPERYVPELDGSPLAGNLAHSATVYHEVCRIHGGGPIDVISAPLWACEGLPCSLDDRFPTVLTLMTSMHTVASLHPSWQGDASVKQVIALERALATRAQYLHPISGAILEKVRGDYGAQGRAEVLPLGVRDRHAEYPRRRGIDGKVRVLFVGRLERRKGVDVLLEAAVRLVRQYPQAEFVLAGKDTPNTETGATYRAQFDRTHGADPAVAGRVTFTGPVSEDELYRHYADADIVCLPSRYESFGLVLVEGMAFGKPVVGCAVGGMCAIVEEGGNGLLAKPDDVDALADCLGRLIADAGLRRRFGERSRARFEEAFALPVVVANTVRYYRQVSQWHAERGCPAADPAAGLAEVIVETAGLRPEAAGRAAGALLDPSRYPVDQLAVLRRVWHQPAEAFLAGVYNLLLGRDPDPTGQAHYLALLQGGAARDHVLRCLAESAEARRPGRSLAWLDALAPGRDQARGLRRILRKAARVLLGRGGAEGGAVVSFENPRGRLGRVVRMLRAAASPKNVVRYLKRAVLLPWNFQKLFDAFANVQEQFRLQTEAHEVLQRQIRERVEAFLREMERMEQQMGETLRAVIAAGRDDALLVQQEVRQLKYRYAEFYGALAEGQKELARSLEGVRTGRAPESVLSDGEPLPLPRVVNLEMYRARVGRMGEAVRIHLVGAGGPRPDYINVDVRPGLEIDVVAEVDRLPFAPGSLAELSCSHLADRFHPDHLAAAILPYWKDLLRPGGTLRLVCPNWEKPVRQLRDGTLQTPEFLGAVARAWDRQGGGPLALHTPGQMAALLGRCGFVNVEVVASGEEMEIVASLPAEGARLSAG